MGVIEVVPIPMLPEASIRTRSVVAVLNATVLAAGRNIPLVGTAEKLGINAVDVVVLVVVNAPAPLNNIACVVPPYHLNCPSELLAALNHIEFDSMPSAKSTVDAPTFGYNISLVPTLLLVNVGAAIPFPFHPIQLLVAPVKLICGPVALLNVPVVPLIAPLLVILAANNAPVLLKVAVVMLVLTTALASCASPLVFNVTPVMLALLVTLPASSVPVLFNVAVVMLVLTTILACCASPLVFIVAPNTLALL